jgi:hypothetical protein
MNRRVNVLLFVSIAFPVMLFAQKNKSPIKVTVSASRDCNLYVDGELRGAVAGERLTIELPSGQAYDFRCLTSSPVHLEAEDDWVAVDKKPKDVMLREFLAPDTEELIASAYKFKWSLFLPESARELSGRKDNCSPIVEYGSPPSIGGRSRTTGIGSSSYWTLASPEILICSRRPYVKLVVGTESAWYPLASFTIADKKGVLQWRK